MLRSAERGIRCSIRKFEECHNLLLFAALRYRCEAVLPGHGMRLMGWSTGSILAAQSLTLQGMPHHPRRGVGWPNGVLVKAMCKSIHLRTEKNLHVLVQPVTRLGGGDCAFFVCDFPSWSIDRVPFVLCQEMTLWEKACILSLLRLLGLLPKCPDHISPPNTVQKRRRKTFCLFSVFFLREMAFSLSDIWPLSSRINSTKHDQWRSTSN